MRTGAHGTDPGAIVTEARAGRLATAIDWAFRDRRTGAITIAQRPNLPLWLFLALSGLGWAMEALAPGTARPVATGLRLASSIALAWWALDEILRGVNPWRRILGAVTLAGMIALSVWRLVS